MDEKQRISCALNKIFEVNKPKMPVDARFPKVKSAGESVLCKVGKLDTRFCVDYKYVGSWPCGTSALTVNECDVVIPVKIQGFLEKTRDPEYVKFRPSGKSIETWKDCIDATGFMNPVCFSDTFYHLVERAFMETKKELNFTPTLRGQGTVAATIVYHFPGLFETSVDLVPIIVVDLNGDRCNDFFSQGYETLRDIPVELAAKNNESGGFGWRLSFSCFETDLIKTILKSHATFQKLMIIYKLIRRFYLAPKEETTFPEKHGYTPVLKSYHIKILLLNEHKEYTNPRDWTEEGLVTRFLSILQRLKGYAKTGFLPHYILSNVNLFNYGIPLFLLKHDLVTNTTSFLDEMAKTNLLK